MALRNISNMVQIPTQQVTHLKQAKLIKNNENYSQVNTMIKHANGKTMKTCASSSSSSSAASSNHQHYQPSSVHNYVPPAQIRTSSPISTSSGSTAELISPSKFLRNIQPSAVHNSRRTQNYVPIYQQLPVHQQDVQQGFNSAANYVSMRDLAFEKLKKQQLIEADLKSTFKLNENQLNLEQLNSNRLRSMGKLKISIYNNCNHLTVHIVEGRSYKIQSNLNTYVKVSMLPDPERRFVKYQTASCASLEYDTKFSFEIDRMNDLDNRLIISVWTPVNDTLIGCFSFKIKHLMSKTHPKPQWFHLLPLKYGLCKHIKVDKNNQVTNVNKDIIGMHKVNFTLNKQNENDSYGFTITNSCPCMIGKVDLNKYAFSAGLRPGDFISKINNKNVSRATCESVVKLIKSSKSRLDIEVYRKSDCSNPILGKLNKYETDSTATTVSTTTTTNSTLSSLEDDFNFPLIQMNLPVQQTSMVSSAKALESVPEEEEEDEDELDENNEAVEDEEDEEDEEEDFEDVQKACASFIPPMDDRDEDYFKAYQSIRFVDSSSLSSEDNQPNNENEAESLRRAAQQFYSSNSSLMLPRKANILSLRNAARANEINKQSNEPLANFNQFC